jgi:hypothetical protein
MYFFVVRTVGSSGLLSAPSVEVWGRTAGLAPSAPQPILNCPSPMAMSSDGNAVPVTFAPSVSGGTSPFTYSCSPASGSLFPVGSTPFTCNVVDALQMADSCNGAVVVSGPGGASPTPGLGTPPSIICPAPTGMSFDGNAIPLTYSASVIGGAAPVTTSCAPPSGSLFAVGTTAINCTAVDGLNQTASCTSAAVVVSNSQNVMPLSIECPARKTVMAPNGRQVKVNYVPTVLGGAGPVSTVCTPPSGSFFAVGTTPIVCTAIDARRVSESCQTAITVGAEGVIPPPPPTGTPIEFDGFVSSAAGRCPAISFVVGTRTIAADAYTDYSRGSCSSLSTGKTVHVVAVVDSSSRILATSVTFTK